MTPTYPNITSDDFKTLAESKSPSSLDNVVIRNGALSTDTPQPSPIKGATDSEQNRATIEHFVAVNKATYGDTLVHHWASSTELEKMKQEGLPLKIQQVKDFYKKVDQHAALSIDNRHLFTTEEQEILGDYHKPEHLDYYEPEQAQDYDLPPLPEWTKRYAFMPPEEESDQQQEQVSTARTKENLHAPSSSDSDDDSDDHLTNTVSTTTPPTTPPQIENPQDAPLWHDLEATQQAALLRGESVCITEAQLSPVAKTQSSFTFTTYQLTQATPAQAASLFWDVAMAPQVIPNCVDAVISEKRSSADVSVTYTIKIPVSPMIPSWAHWMFKKDNDQLKLHREITQSRRFRDTYSIDWGLKGSKYLTKHEGSFLVMPHRQQTLLRTQTTIAMIVERPVIMGIQTLPIVQTELEKGTKVLMSNLTRALQKRMENNFFSSPLKKLKEALSS